MKAILTRLSAVLLSHNDLIFTNGLEKENLRVDLMGHQAFTDHPAIFGKSLTHPLITTDFSENLLEMVTAPVEDQALFQTLTTLNAYISQSLDHELLWPLSMPGWIEDVNQVRIARYGDSHIAKMKQVYRRGLVLRYGKLMQLIAGMHFNLSFQPGLFAALQSMDGNQEDLGVFTSKRMMRLVRHFYCVYPMLVYLFGASPSCTTQMITSKRPGYLMQQDEQTLIGPYATSLRMSDLGYHNSAQDLVKINLASVTQYAESLIKATQTPYSAYEQLGIKNTQGQYQQLNTHWLQIENEYYSSIRPKQIAQKGERPALALKNRGVAYIEMRALDLNPLSPVGIDQTQIDFINLVMLWCLLQEDCCLSPEDCCALRQHVKQVVTVGRKPGLTLQTITGKVLFTDWLRRQLDELAELAQWLDQHRQTTQYVQAVNTQMRKVIDPDLTPSAQVLEGLTAQKLSHQDYGLKYARIHAELLKKMTLNAQVQAKFSALARQSEQDWQQLEKPVDQSFEQFLQQYFQQR